MPKKHDIIIIGAGAGGLDIAGFMNNAGFDVLLIDKDKESVGGDSLNHGCIPSKALIYISKIIADARSAGTFGLKISGRIDMEKINSYIRKKQDKIREYKNADYLRKKGIDLRFGKVRFTGRQTIRINKEEHTAKRIVIATGSRPRIPKIKGLEETDYLTSESLFDLKKLPKKLVVIGGGPIGIELGQAMQNLGSKVVIVQRSKQFLPRESQEIVYVLKRHLMDAGIEFLFESNPIEFHKKSVLIEKTNCRSVRLRFDKVLISTGRVPNIEGMDLEKAGIEVEDGRIVADEYLRTTNRSVFLCGDVAGPYQFTHVAQMHARLLIHNFFSPIKKKIDYSNIGWVTYTKPEVATFGLDHKKISGICHEKIEINFKEDERAVVESATDSKIILYVSKDRILGGSIVANNAGEIVQELILARSAKLDIRELFNKTYPYPTASRINRQAISKLYKKRFTEFKKDILKRLY